MASTPNHASDMLIRKLERHTPLSRAERQAVERLPITVKPISAHQYIQQNGDKLSQSYLVLDGWLHQSKITNHGGRQIYSFEIPGDIVNLQNLYHNKADRDAGTLTTVTLASIQHEDLRELVGSFTGIAKILWRDTMIAASVLRERMASMGRRSAAEAVGHLICELYIRLQSVGLARNATYNLPLTQQDIGDALGISSVHINRVLKDLRDKTLIQMCGRDIHIINWRELSKLCDFNPDYLIARTGDENEIEVRASQSFQSAGAD